MSAAPVRTILALVAFLSLGVARGDDPAFSVVTPGGSSGTVTSTQGWSFTAGENLRVTKLGVYDRDDNGLAEAHDVAIWEPDGKLVALATVPAGTTAPLDAGWRYVNIPPTVLAKGQVYVIGAYYLTSADGIRIDGVNATIIAPHPAVISTSGRFGLSHVTGLDFPADSSANERFGPNFTFTVRPDETAVAVVSPGGSGGTVTSTQGWSFTAARNMRVKKLGVLDRDNDGLGEAHDVAIWGQNGKLVALANVPAGTAAPLVNGWRYVDIPPVVLTRGQVYVIGAYYLTAADGIRNDGANGTVMAYNGAVTGTSGRFGILHYSGIDFPSDSSSAIERMGPNFTFAILADTTWPTGAAPCNNIANLQACIDAASDGDIIEIAANAIPAQSVTPQVKSFTLRPATGFVPTFADYTNFYLQGGALPVTVTVEGLTIARGTIAGGVGTGPLTLAIRGNTIGQTATFGSAFDFGNRSGPTDLLIENNTIHINVGASDYVSGISVSGLSGSSNTARIRGNVIDQVGGGQNGAIDVYNSSGVMTAHVISNRVSGDNFNDGVGLFQQGAGTLTGRVINNVISGQVNYAGGPSGIAMYVSEGHGDFTVLNNTVAYNDGGIQLGGRPDLGATATAVISNNIVAFNTLRGMNLQDFDVTNDFNLVHGNGSNEYTPGIGTQTTNPLFVSSSNLRPILGSPALNSGSNARVPADITTDVIGYTRIQGYVDRGAFEIASGGADVDADGLPDAADNCTVVANPDQRDTDQDGYGNICDADLDNSSGIVNFSDLALFRAAFGSADADADFDGSGGIVNFTDLARFRLLFGQSPGPSGLHP